MGLGLVVGTGLGLVVGTGLGLAAGKGLGLAVRMGLGLAVAEPVTGPAVGMGLRPLGVGLELRPALAGPGRRTVAPAARWIST